MKLKADNLNIMQDILNGGFLLSMHVHEIPSGAEKLREEALAVSITKWRERRSLTANAYYWVLVSKIAEAAGMSNARAHNMLLRSYGVPETIGGQLTIAMLPVEAEDEILERELYHLKPTSKTKVGKDGQIFRAYILGTVEEAKMLGLETLPEEEIERMMAAYEINHSNGR